MVSQILIFFSFTYNARAKTLQNGLDSFCSTDRRKDTPSYF